MNCPHILKDLPFVGNGKKPMMNFHSQSRNEMLYSPRFQGRKRQTPISVSSWVFLFLQATKFHVCAHCERTQKVELIVDDTRTLRYGNTQNVTVTIINHHQVEAISGPQNIAQETIHACKRVVRILGQLPET